MDWAFLINKTCPCHCLHVGGSKIVWQESLPLQTVERRFPSLLALPVFLPSLPWCSLDYRCRTYDAHMSTGAGLSTLHLYIASDHGFLWRSLPLRVLMRGESYTYSGKVAHVQRATYLFSWYVYDSVGMHMPWACMCRSEYNFGGRFFPSAVGSRDWIQILRFVWLLPQKHFDDPF